MLENDLKPIYPSLDTTDCFVYIFFCIDDVRTISVNMWGN